MRDKECNIKYFNFLYKIIKFKLHYLLRLNIVKRNVENDNYYNFASLFG